MIDVTKLVAGRELDALVAELVMGFHWEAWQTGSGLYDQKGVKRGKRFLVNGLVFEEVPPMGHEAVPTRPLPPYSSEIDAAWLVLERILEIEKAKKTDLPVFSVQMAPDGCSAVLQVGMGCTTVVENASTAPLAICRAALRAVTA